MSIAPPGYAGPAMLSQRSGRGEGQAAVKAARNRAAVHALVSAEIGELCVAV